MPIPVSETEIAARSGAAVEWSIQRFPGCELDRIAQQIGEDFPEPHAVGQHNTAS